MPKFPQSSRKEFGVGLPPIKARAIQMGIEDLTNAMSNCSEREYLAHAHIKRLLNRFRHWPIEVLQSNPVKLPTLRILRMAEQIP